MAGKSNYLENKLLNFLKGTAMGTAPTSLYCRLFTADPTDAGTLTSEVTATIRPAGGVAVTWGSVSDVSGANSIANSAIVDFGVAAAAPGAAVTHFGLFDAATAGNMYYSEALTTPRTVVLGGAVSFAIGALTVAEG